MPAATAIEISNYLDDMKAGLDAGPVGSPEFRQAVYESQERRKGAAPEAVKHQERRGEVDDSALRKKDS